MDEYEGFAPGDDGAGRDGHGHLQAAPQPAPGHAPPGQGPPAPGQVAFGPPVEQPSEPIILSRTPAREATADAAMPGRALVFSDRDGHAVLLNAPPRGRFGGFGGPSYEWRLEVDTSLRSDTFTASIPSRTETAHFVVTVEAEWSVTDPVQVVRRGLSDGARFVRSRLLAAVRLVGHGHRIDQISELEAALTGKLGAGCREYPEGITVHRCYVTADPDERSRAKQERLDDARVERQLTDEEVSALRTSLHSQDDLFLLNLARDKSGVENLVAEMREQKKIKDERVIELFNKAVEQNIMQPAEINDMLSRLLGPITGVFQPGGRTDLFGTQQIPAVAPAEPAAPAAILGSLAADEDDDEDVMPEELRQRAEDGVDGWRPMPWES